MKRTACQREKFVELTEKQIKDTLKGLTTDEVYGLRLSEAGELELDTDGFHNKHDEKDSYKYISSNGRG